MFGFRSSDEIFREFYGPGYRTFEFGRTGVFGKGFVFYDASGRRHGAEAPGANRAQGLVPMVPFPGVLGKVVRYLLQKTLGIQFPEKGKDWKDVITLSPEQAQKGGEIGYPYRKWGKPKNLMVKVPAGIRNGQHIRLTGMGAPGKAGGESGDLYLQVRIKVPLSQRIKDFFT